MVAQQCEGLSATELHILVTRMVGFMVYAFHIIEKINIVLKWVIDLYVNSELRKFLEYKGEQCYDFKADFLM
jgi:hypothetical protein